MSISEQFWCFNRYVIVCQTCCVLLAFFETAGIYIIYIICIYIIMIISLQCVKYIILDLISLVLTQLLQRLRLLTFGYFYCFLELFIVKFILNFNNEHA